MSLIIRTLKGLLILSLILSQGCLDTRGAVSREDKNFLSRPWGALEYEIFRIGIAHARKERYDEAIDAFGRVILINPRNALAYFSRGIFLAFKGNFNQAIADYDKALEINPDLAEVYSSRGLAYQRKGNLNQAISDYDKALEIKPGLAEAYYKRSIAYFYAKEYEASWQDLDRAKALGYEVSPDFIEELMLISEFGQ